MSIVGAREEGQLAPEGEASNGAADSLRIGIIGASGTIGQVHGRAARAAGATLVAVATSSPSTAEAAALELGADHAYSSTDELLDREDVDIVHVCTPNHLHAQITAAALRRGKHVICEKPVGTSLDDIEKVVDAAANRPDLLVAVPFVYRFYPMVSVARRRLTDTQLWGITGSYLQDWLAAAADTDWRVDATLGGPSRAFADIGAHWCDLAEFLTGQRITRLTARTTVTIGRRSQSGAGASPTPVDTEDDVALIFETDGGAIGSMSASQTAHGHKNDLRIEVKTDEETIHFSQENPEVLAIGNHGGIFLLRRQQADDTGEPIRHSRLPPGHPQGYQDAFNSFVACAYRSTSVREDDLPTLADGVRSLHITHAVLQSADSGTWVEVAP